MRMKRTGRNIATLVTVLLLVLITACAPAPQEITPTPTPTPPPEEITPPAPIAPAGMGILEVRVTDPPEPEFDSILVSVDNITTQRLLEKCGARIYAEGRYLRIGMLAFNKEGKPKKIVD